MGVLLRAGLRGQGRRLVSAGLAVGLGVMFLAVTLLMSDTLATTIERQAAGSVGRYAAAVTVPPSAESRIGEQRLQEVLGVPQVASVHAVKEGGVMLGRGTLVSLATAPPEGSLTFAQGRAPTGRGEVALTESARAALAVGVGDTVAVPEGERGGATPGSEPMTQVTVVGIVEPGPDLPGQASFPLGIATNETLTALTGDPDYSELLVTGAPGTTPAEVRDAVGAAVGGDLRTLTGEEEAQRRIEEMAGGRDMLTRVLVVFAAVALFTCAIVVANTFTILLAQRQRHLALLRCVGAGRGQIVRSVLLEAVVLGLLASTAGVLLALGLGWIGVLLTQRFAVEAGVEGLALSPVSLLAPLLVGVVMTVMAALLPAVRATRTSPLVALRPELPPTGRVRIARVAAGGIAVVAGVALLVLGVSGGGLAAGIGGGFLSFAGVLALGPVIVPWAAGTARWSARRSVGPPGALAVENARRNPQRAAATTSALLVGVTLITMMTVGATIARQVATDEITAQVPVDAVAEPAGEHGPTASDISTLRAVEGVEGVAVVRSLHDVRIGSTGDRLSVTAVGEDARGVIRSPAVFERLAPGVLLLPEATATGLGLADGQQVTLPWGTATVRLGPMDAAVISASDVPQDSPGSNLLWMRFHDDADVTQVVTRLHEAAAGLDGMQVTGMAVIRAQIDTAVETVLMVTIALLAVAVVIALVGIGNTLGLSVLERTRESALLRAMGLTTGQLRLMLAVEAVVLAAVAVVLGVLLGIGYGWAGIATLFADMADDGVPLIVPWDRVAVVALVALVAGLLASVLPARRAARVAPAAALSAE